MSALTDLFSNIATAIREKTGSSETISAATFPAAISAIPSGSTLNIVELQITSDGGVSAFVVPESIRSSEHLIAIRTSGVEKSKTLSFPGITAFFLDITGGDWCGLYSQGTGVFYMSGNVGISYNATTGAIASKSNERVPYFVAGAWNIYAW